MRKTITMEIYVLCGILAALELLLCAVVGRFLLGLGLALVTMGMALLGAGRVYRHFCSCLEEKERDLSAISDNMKEGLILLDKEGRIISMNHGAAQLLQCEGSEQKGESFLSLPTHPTLLGTVRTALFGVARQELLELSGATVDIYADPVLVDGQVRGVVLLLFDVTERAAAEQLRREFTANVSHELKTPLTAISGYAELLKLGLVPAEDVAAIGGSIGDEAARLLTLIEDIIDLSSLDESEELRDAEEVDLHALAGDVVERLQSAALRYGVALRLSGESQIVRGSRRLLEEMIGNLAENALKYNRPGGEAEVCVAREGECVVLTVSDNGIGIAREHQPHVFERFYRVDKSRSKSTGGTGLGLSIVKHGAARHGAALELESQSGRGSRFTLRFPAV